MSTLYPFTFRNDAAEEIPGFGVMQCTGIVTVDGRDILKIAKPDATLNPYYFVNSPRPVAANRFGNCANFTQVPALYDESDGTPAYGEFWGIKSAEWKLRITRYGFQILGGVRGTPTTGVPRVTVQQFKVTSVRAKLAEQLDYRDTAIATVHVKTVGGATDTSLALTITVTDGLLKTGEHLPTNTFVVAHLMAGQWIVGSADECGTT